jgi:predicted enzyme related to lactoylglutathione lyase
MDLPEDARKMGATPRWIGYVGVDDVDAAADRIKRLGGAVLFPPTDIPDIGRLAVVADPQSATLGLFKWLKPGQQQPAELAKPGRVGWHELLAANWEKALAFYSELFGWQKGIVEIDAMGTYQLFSAGGRMIGGMFTKPPMVQVPFWLYYFDVDDIDAAAKRVMAGGGHILEGLVEGPGARWIARCTDPQGAVFALTGKRSNKAVGYFEPAASRDSSASRSFVPRKALPNPQAARLSVGRPRFRPAAKRKLTDRAFDVELDCRHFREQLDIGTPDRASAKPHIGRHHVERLNQYADVLQNERICDRAVFP